MSESKPNTAGDEVVDANVVDAKTEKSKVKSKDVNQAKPDAAATTAQQPSPDKGAEASTEVDPPIPATPNYHWPN